MNCTHYHSAERDGLHHGAHGTGHGKYDRDARHVGIGWQDKGCLHGGGWPRRSHGVLPVLRGKELTSTGKGGQVFSGNFRKKKRGKNPSLPRLPAIVNRNRLPGRKMSPGPHKKSLRGLHRKIRASPEKPPFAEKCDGVHGHFVPFVGECTHGGFKNGKDHCRI